MFAPDWDEGCDGCSMMAEHVGPLSRIHAPPDVLRACLSGSAVEAGVLPGEEPFMMVCLMVLGLLDLTPFGRQKTWENSPPGWPQEPTYSWMRLSDRYEGTPGLACHHHASD